MSNEQLKIVEKADTRLSPHEWVQTGLNVLVKHGIDAVNIIRLANELGVSRGSFYWHFKDRDALLVALLETWRERNTGVMVDVLRNPHSLADGILDLFSVWVDHSKFDPLLDQAVRDWARRSDYVHEVVSGEDDNRVAVIASFFQDQGFDNTDAFVRARVIYFTQLSFYALRVDEPLETRMSYLKAYYRTFTGQELDDKIAGTFSQKLMRKQA